MNLYLKSTANLGDFLNSLPVMAGLNASYGPINLIIRSGMRKFNGIKEFLMYQGLFEQVSFEDEIYFNGVTEISSWAREDRNDMNRPIETCRYENWMKDQGFKFDVVDDFKILVPNLDIDVPTGYVVGDRWDVGGIDARRETNVLSYLNQYDFLDYNNDLLTNAYILKNLKKPFITNMTGVAVLADLLDIESYIVWKAEDWKPEFRKGDNIDWDNGKDITTIFQKHFYADRHTKLIHSKELESFL